MGKLFGAQIDLDWLFIKTTKCGQFSAFVSMWLQDTHKLLWHFNYFRRQNLWTYGKKGPCPVSVENWLFWMASWSWQWRSHNPMYGVTKYDGCSGHESLGSIMAVIRCSIIILSAWRVRCRQTEDDRSWYLIQWECCVWDYIFILVRHIQRMHIRFWQMFGFLILNHR